MTDVIMPQMGESVTEGTVTRWLKQVGERVGRDEPLLEISTDKVDAEVPAPVAGVLSEILVFEGRTVAVETVLGTISPDAEVAERASTAREADTIGATEPSAQETQPIRPAAEATPEEQRRQRSSPVVRRIAREHDVDITAIPGTGIGGRVTKEDILGYISQRGESGDTPSRPATDVSFVIATDAPQTTAAPAAARRDVASDRSRLVPMSPIQKKTAENMLAARRAAAHATTVWEIDMTRVAQLRETRLASYQERYGVHLTFLPFILKATVDSLKAFPLLNASIEGDAIRYHDEVHLGVAVALERRGLIAPVIRRADEKNLLGLARTASDLSDRARAKRLQPSEVQGATFTITNPGVFGGLFGTSIILQPQVGILAVGAIEKRAVAREDAIAVRTMAYFSLSFDHRIVDGADADRFMADLKRRLQEFDESEL